MNYALTILLILLAYVVYAYWVRPVRMIKEYVRNIRSRGYKVLEVPYIPFSVDLIGVIKRGMAQGDALKVYKEERCNYDAVVSNAFTRPRIELYHPDFLKDFYSVDKHYEYPKSIRPIRLFTRVAGKGLVFSEGEVWHRKRRILNKIFNFDFIKSQSGYIAEICDSAMKEI